MLLFTLLGAMLIVYVIYAVTCGVVYARSGVWGKRVDKEESPDEFWRAVAIYTVIGILLLIFF